MDVVPRCFPVAQAADVFDRNERLRVVTQDVSDQLILAFDFGRFVRRIIKHEAVEVAKNVVANPAQDFEMAGGKHRR